MFTTTTTAATEGKRQTKDMTTAVPTSWRNTSEGDTVKKLTLTRRTMRRRRPKTPAFVFRVARSRTRACQIQVQYTYATAVLRPSSSTSGQKRQIEDKHRHIKHRPRTICNQHTTREREKEPFSHTHTTDTSYLVNLCAFYIIYYFLQTFFKILLGLVCNRPRPTCLREPNMISIASSSSSNSTKPATQPYCMICFTPSARRCPKGIWFLVRPSGVPG